MLIHRLRAWGVLCSQPWPFFGPSYCCHRNGSAAVDQHTLRVYLAIGVPKLTVFQVSNEVSHQEYSQRLNPRQVRWVTSEVPARGRHLALLKVGSSWIYVLVVCSSMLLGVALCLSGSPWLGSFSGQV